MDKQPRDHVVDRIDLQLLSSADIRKLSVGRVITPDLYDEDGFPLSGGLQDLKFGPAAPGERCVTCGNHMGTCLGHFGHVELARPVVREEHARHILFALQLTCWHCHRLLVTEEGDPLHPDRVQEFLRCGQESREESRRGDGDCRTLQGVARQLVLEGGRRGEEVRRKLWAIYNNLMREDKRFPWEKSEESDEPKPGGNIDAFKEEPDQTCPHCHAMHRKVTLEHPTTFYEEEAGKGSRLLTPGEIFDRLEHVSDEDCWCLGMNPSAARPERMLVQVLPVPPTCVRPTVTLDDGTHIEDDLTQKLVDIVRINQRLASALGAGMPPLVVNDLWELLQYHVTTYFNNQVPHVPPARDRSGRALKTLAQRLEGKEGRFRNNLSGKRVNFCARTVISPAPNLGTNQLGVPRRIAMKLTVPERVTAWNLELIKLLVIHGPKRHPGANYLVRADGRRIALHVVKDRRLLASLLQPGCVVERHLRDGDIVLFNRQPSLHRMSIMAHEIVVVSGKTFRLPVAACTPYNADFDGDEMNLHVPQDEEARAEASHLLLAQLNIISPRSGVPVMGCIQDHISMAHLLTRDDAYFTRAQTSQLLYHGNVFQRNPEFRLGRDLKPRIINPEPLYWGKDIFSALLPRGTFLSTPSKFCKKCKPCLYQDCPFDAFVVVRDGRLLRGTIDKATLGAMQPHALLQRVVQEHGHTRGRQFLDDVSQMLLALLPMAGLTMGLDEITVGGDASFKIVETLEKSYQKASEYIQAYHDKDEKILHQAPGLTLAESLEVSLTRILGEARNTAGDIAADFLGDRTHSVIMTKSGARGNPLNLAQMAACVGQQSVRGARIHRGYGDRTLPHILEGDLSPSARGFVMSSYRQGLNPVEFFFHAMGGREGLVDTAARTSTSGYFQRRLVNALQDLKVAQDWTVRDARGCIVQFRYGDDGIDPARSDHGNPIDLDTLLLKTQTLQDLVQGAFQLRTNEEGTFYFQGALYFLGATWGDTVIQVSLERNCITVRTIDNVPVKMFCPGSGVFVGVRPAAFSKGV